MKEHILKTSSLITENHQEFKKLCKVLSQFIKNEIGEKDTTWSYRDYNVFVASSSTYLFYKLYEEVRNIVRGFVGHDRPLWIQAWLNYTECENLEEILKPHFHGFNYHGYVSIDPKNTTTIFNNGLEINNKVGQIYLGPGRGMEEPYRYDYDHYVKINERYSGHRITLGFDIASDVNVLTPNKFIPLV